MRNKVFLLRYFEAGTYFEVKYHLGGYLEKEKNFH